MLERSAELSAIPCHAREARGRLQRRIVASSGRVEMTTVKKGVSASGTRFGVGLQNNLCELRHMFGPELRRELPAEFKHIIKRRKRKQLRFP